MTTDRSAFIAAPFASYMNPETSQVHDEKKRNLEDLIKVVQDCGYQVRNAHYREEWGAKWMDPEICTPLDYEDIKASLVLIAIPGNPASGGVHIELGWASALNKRIILLLENNKHYSNLVEGLGTVTNVSYIWFDDFHDGLSKLYARLSRIDGS
ncbi:MAG: nucleoside 2-deoxyribosyltransferase [Nanoarchaeota archaeon]